MDAALGLLVTHRITGLPVVDAGGRVVGVVSDFDLLALDSGAGAPAPGAGGGVFPAPGADWASFLASREAAAKAVATTVADVMTNRPVVVSGTESLAAAARTLMATRVGRLPVVDGDGRLIGLFSRSDVIRAAYEARREQQQIEEEG